MPFERIGQAEFPGIASVAIQDETDVPGQHAALNFPEQSTLVEPIQQCDRIKHHRAVTIGPIVLTMLTWVAGRYVRPKVYRANGSTVPAAPIRKKIAQRRRGYPSARRRQGGVTIHQKRVAKAYAYARSVQAGIRATARLVSRVYPAKAHAETSPLIRPGRLSRRCVGSYPFTMKKKPPTATPKARG